MPFGNDDGKNPNEMGKACIIQLQFQKHFKSTRKLINTTHDIYKKIYLN